MTSRDDILAAIRQHAVPPVDLPDVDSVGIVYDDPRSQFDATLAAVGGLPIRVPDAAALKQRLVELPVYRQARRIYSSLPDLEPGNVDLDALDDPKELNGLDLAILPGQFAVAENGAVWLDCQGLRHRAVHVAAEHLVLVVPEGELVHNMHQAYGRLKFAGPGQGLFISGPSKTADIEQSLVIGAQGPRSLTVFLAG